MRSESIALHNVRHPQFPARGRKLVKGKLGGNPEEGQTPSIPRKGTETDSVGVAFLCIGRSDTLNSPQGDGNGYTALYPPKDMMCQTPSIPRKGTETRDLKTLKTGARGVRHPQFPARGRKPRRRSTSAMLGFSQTPSIPRKGTETDLLLDLDVSPGILSDTLNSPQGDGNQNHQPPALSPRWGQTPSIPRKGTETGQLPIEIVATLLGQTPSIPRKGTETSHSSALSTRQPSVRHPQFPARGRKPDTDCRSRIRGCSPVRHPQFPARGRKHDLPVGLNKHSKGQTPSIPRKGTETILIRIEIGPVKTLSDTLNSPQGDGNRGLDEV